MKNITKVGLSALAGALAMTSANAGDLSLTGSMEVTWTTGSGYQDTGNNFGQENEMTTLAVNADPDEAGVINDPIDQRQDTHAPDDTKQALSSTSTGPEASLETMLPSAPY